MSSTSSGDPVRPNPRAAAYRGGLADPRPLALAAQSMIAVETLLHVAITVTGSRDSAIAWAAPLSLPLFLITVGLFLCWFHRCHRNAELFAPGRQHHSDSGAVGIWFHPVRMFWAPRRATLDIWHASGGTGSPWLINAWWIAWLAEFFGGIAYSASGGTVFDPGATHLFQIAVVAAGLAILMIHQLTTAQDAKVGLAVGRLSEPGVRSR